MYVYMSDTNYQQLRFDSILITNHIISCLWKEYEMFDSACILSSVFYANFNKNTCINEKVKLFIVN